MKKLMPFLFLFIAWMFTSLLQTVNAQDTIKPKKDLKNTVHVNLTNFIFFNGRSFVFGYERVVNKHQAFTVNIGTNGLPSLRLDRINSDSIASTASHENSGFNLSVDYRFYLAKENKYVAPRGVYIGPYYSYNNFHNKRDWNIKTVSGSQGNVGTDMKLNVHTIGAELGYQFILWRRLALDFVMVGPGFAFYKLDAALNSDLSLTQQDKEKLNGKLISALSDRFPGFNFVASEDSEKEFQSKGTTNISSIGYRFMIQIGFRF
jgi:hypothetical protein